MQTTIFLHESEDATDAYALSLPGDSPGSWRAQKGFGAKFKQVWTIDLLSGTVPATNSVDWDQVLERAIEAYSMSDPVLTNFVWPTFDSSHA